MKQKREQEEVERQKYKIFCLIKSDALQAYKNMKTNEANAIRRQRQRSERMIHMIKARRLLQRAWKTITQRIEDHKTQRRIDFMAQCICFKTRRLLRKRGATLDDRLKREI